MADQNARAINLAARRAIDPDYVVGEAIEPLANRHGGTSFVGRTRTSFIRCGDEASRSRERPPNHGGRSGGGDPSGGSAGGGPRGCGSPGGARGSHDATSTAPTPGAARPP